MVLLLLMMMMTMVMPKTITIIIISNTHMNIIFTVYPKKYAHGFVVLCFVVVMQWFIMNSHEVFIHIHQGCFAGTGAIVRLPQCQWSKPDGYGKISQCITTTKHNKAKTVCIFLGIYCTVKKKKKKKTFWKKTPAQLFKLVNLLQFNRSTHKGSQILWLKCSKAFIMVHLL